MDTGSSTNTTLLSAFYSKHELLEIFLAVVGTFGNCLVCVAILKNTSLQIAANFYMVSLTIADLLFTAVLVPMRAAQNFAFYNDKAVQQPVVHVLSFIGRITILASISSLAVLTDDRRIALRHPLKYPYQTLPIVMVRIVLHNEVFVIRPQGFFYSVSRN